MARRNAGKSAGISAALQRAVMPGKSSGLCHQKESPRCSVMHRGLFHPKAGILGCFRIPGLSKKAFSDCMAAFRAAGQKEIVFGAALEKQRRLRGCPAVFQRAMPFPVSRDPVGSEGSRDFYHAASLIQGGGDQRFKTVTGRAGPFHTFSSRHG